MSPGLEDGPRLISPGLESPLPMSPAHSLDIIDYISNGRSNNILFELKTPPPWAVKRTVVLISIDPLNKNNKGMPIAQFTTVLLTT